MKRDEFENSEATNEENNEKKGGKKVIIALIGMMSVVLIGLIVFGMSYVNRQREIKQADAFILMEKYDHGISIYDDLLSKKYSVTIMNKRDLAVEQMESAENLRKGLEAFEEDDINKAIRFLSKVPQDDTKRYELALEELTNIEETILIDVNQLIEDGDLDQANEIVNNYLKADAKNVKMKNKKDSINTKKAEAEKQAKVEEENKVKNQEAAATQAAKEAEAAAVKAKKDAQARSTADSIVGTYKSIISSEANLREAPTLSSGIVTVLYRGAIVYIHDTQIESAERIWCYVSTQEHGYTDYGWISYNTMNYSIK